MLVVRTRAELDEAIAELRGGGLALVPTMGALHAGHLALVKAASRVSKAVAASIFVNPLQFAPAEDLARYPRDAAGDIAKLKAVGCDLVWLPDVASIYPPENATTIDVAGPALGWEGDVRHGHFRGVATVVAKLFGHVRPDIGVFGEKDWQQLQVVRRMVRDLQLNLRILGVPTMREADGLAMSSRNRFLTAAERIMAPALYHGLLSARSALHAGEMARIALAGARDALVLADFSVDYLALVDGETLREIDQPVRGARLIVAARLGHVRLLDNVSID